MESKARWFQSLSLSERMEVFCSYTNFILSVNPKIMEMKCARPIEGRIRVISKHEVKKSAPKISERLVPKGGVEPPRP